MVGSMPGHTVQTKVLNSGQLDAETIFDHTGWLDAKHFGKTKGSIFRFGR